MYTQAMDTMGKDEARKPVRSAEEMQLEERFDARIDAGDRKSTRLNSSHSS